jgi:hypothetical protein
LRIKSVRLAWFRGAADPVALEPGCKSIVVYGQNGAGKSSFVDSIEYVTHNGRLLHLTHEYSGRNQENAIRNTHTPADRNTEFWITFQDESELNVKIARNGTHTKSGDELINMGAWDYRRTVLRQDEVSEFIHSRKGEKYSALLPLFGLHELEVAAENLRQLSRVVDEQSKLREKRGAFGQTTAKRKQVFGEDTDAMIAAKISVLHKINCPESGTTDDLTRCNELNMALTKRINQLSAENLNYYTLRMIADTDLAVALASVRRANAKLAGSVEPLIAETLEVLQSADAFATRLNDQGDVACPACGRTIPVGEFKAHVKNEQKRLEEIVVIFAERKAEIALLIDDLKSIKTALTKGEIKAWRAELEQGLEKAKVDWIEQCYPEALRQSLSEENLKAIENNCLDVIEAADEAAKNAPPDMKDLSIDKVVAESGEAVFGANELADTVKRIEGLVAFINSVEVGVRDEIRARSKAVIKEISGDISAMWKALHPEEPIEDVRLYLPEHDKAIDIALKFHGKEQDSPRLTLSEGYRNSLGLCIFLALAKRESTNDRPLFLDDVVVSLDRNHRGMIVQLLEDEFAKRQLIILTHDRDWYAELRQQLNDERWKFGSLLPYETPMVGIRWSHKTATFDDARAHLKERPDSAGNDARKIMDIEVSLIAEKLQLRLPYLRGDKNEKRMWNEFLERLIADGKRCFQKRADKDFPCYIDALDLLEGVRKLLVSWGNKSSHSQDVVRPEAARLIDTCENALAVFRCTTCTKPVWFADAENAAWVQCQCGQLRWRYDRG